MTIRWRPLLIVAAVIWLTACGGGGNLASSGAGGSGIGGTGIALVKGNVVSVDGQMFVEMLPVHENHVAKQVMILFVPTSEAQSTNLSNLKVSGGGQSSSIDSSGQFQLQGVNPSDNFVLNFSFNGGSAASLTIGRVSAGAVVTINNIAIDTASGNAQPSSIDVSKSSNNNSGPGDSDNGSEDHNSEDQQDNKSEESVDNGSKGGSPDDSSSQDDNSEDHDSEDNSGNGN